MTGLLVLSLLLIPAVMTGCGWWLRRCSTRINLIYGYRTTMSTRSEEAWNFAQKHCGTLWFRVGLVMLPLSAAALAAAMAQSRELSLYIALAAMAVQLLVMILCCVPTEVALRRTFDRNGRRISE